MTSPTLLTGIDFNTILIFIGLAGAAWVKFREGGKDAKKEADNAQEQTDDARSSYVALLKGQLDSQKQINEENKDKLITLQEQINTLKQEIGKLQGVNETIDKILSRGAPELENTMQAMQLFIAESQVFQAELRKHFELKEPKALQEMHDRVRVRTNK